MEVTLWQQFEYYYYNIIIILLYIHIYCAPDSWLCQFLVNLFTVLFYFLLATYTDNFLFCILSSWTSLANAFNSIRRDRILESVQSPELSAFVHSPHTLLPLHCSGGKPWLLLKAYSRMTLWDPCCFA